VGRNSALGCRCAWGVREEKRAKEIYTLVYEGEKLGETSPAWDRALPIGERQFIKSHKSKGIYACISKEGLKEWRSFNGLKSHLDL